MKNLSSRNPKWQVESLEPMILMSGASFDGGTGVDAEFQVGFGGAEPAASSGIGDLSAANDGEGGTGSLLLPITGPMSAFDVGPGGSFMADGAPGFGSSEPGTAIPEGGNVGIANTGDTVGTGHFFPDSSDAGNPGIGIGDGVGLSTSSEISGPISGFDVDPGDNLVIEGDSQNERLSVRGHSIQGAVTPTNFILQTSGSLSLNEVFIQELRIVGDEIWVLSVVEETPYAAPAEVDGYIGSSLTIEIPTEFHTTGYIVREFRIGGAPDGTVSAAITEVPQQQAFLDAVGVQESEVLYDRDEDGLGYAFPNNEAIQSAVQFGRLTNSDGLEYVMRPTDNSLEDFKWNAVLPGVGPEYEEVVLQEVGFASLSSEYFTVSLNPTELDSPVQPTVFNVGARIQQLDEFYVQEIHIVDDEVWLLTIREQGVEDVAIELGNAGHRVAVDIPAALHEQGYNVREFRVGGSADNGLRTNTTQLESVASFDSLIADADSEILYDHSNPLQAQRQAGWANLPNSLYSLDLVDETDKTESEWRLVSENDGFVGETVGVTAEVIDEIPEDDAETVDSDAAELSAIELADDSSIGQEGSANSGLASTGELTAQVPAGSIHQLAGGLVTGAQQDSSASTLGLISVQGTSASEWLSAESGQQQIDAGGGDDELHAAIGNNILDGGDGVDTFYIYEGTSADFSMETRQSGDVVVTGVGLDGQAVQNTLRNVERIVFNDRAINLNELSVSQTPIPASDVSSIPQIIGGTPSGDNLIGTSVDDEFYSSAGNNVIDGGDGYDTLYVYGGTVNLRGGTNGTGAIPVDQFSVERISDDTVAVAGTTITGDVMQYELTNVERIVFDNDVVYLDGSNGTLAGTGAGEWLATGECTERVQAGGGDDSIYVSNSNIRRVEGGTGIDTLVLDRVSRGDIEIIDAREGFGVYVVFGQQISVDLVDVEFIQFADETLALADIPLGQGSQNYGRSLALPLPLCVHI